MGSNRCLWLHLADLLLELTQEPNKLTKLLGGLLLLAALGELGHLGLEAIDHLVHLRILGRGSYILVLRLGGWLRRWWLRHHLRCRWLLLLLLLLLVQELPDALEQSNGLGVIAAI